MRLHRDHDFPRGGATAPAAEDSLEALLVADHARLDRMFQSIAEEAAVGDSELLHRQWTAFGQELTRHMDAEEVRIISPFGRRHAKEARALLDDHARIRDIVGELAFDLDVHRLSRDHIRALIGELDAHVRRETIVLYPWTTRSFDRAACERYRFARDGEPGCDCCDPASVSDGASSQTAR